MSEWTPDVTTLKWVLRGIEAARVITDAPMPASMERFTKEEIARGAVATAKDAFIASLKTAIAQHENGSPQASLENNADLRKS